VIPLADLAGGCEFDPFVLAAAVVADVPNDDARRVLEVDAPGPPVIRVIILPNNADRRRWGYIVKLDPATNCDFVNGISGFTRKSGGQVRVRPVEALARPGVKIG